MFRSKARIWIAAFVVITVVVAIIFPSAQKPWTDVAWTAINDSEHRLIVATGIRDDKLLFVAITGDDKDSPTITNSIVTGGASTDHNWQILNYPDGTEELLPKHGAQLFQFIDGEWSESSGDVTPAEYDSFYASNPDHYSIECLLEFVENKRRNAR